MAHTVNITSSYSGKASELIIKALFGGKTLGTKGIDIDTEVPYKKTFRSFDMGSLVQTGQSCTFNANGSTTVAESTYDVKDHYIDVLYCYKDFKTSWNYNSNEVPSEILDASDKRVNGEIQADIEAHAFRSLNQSTFTGGTFYVSGQFDGYLKQLKAGSPVTQTGVTITSSNVAAELGKVLLAMPDAIKNLDPSEVVIFVSMNVGAMYRLNLAAQGINTTAEDQSLQYMGYEVRPVNMPKKTTDIMVAGKRSDFHVISNAGLDSVKYDVVNMYPVNLDKSIRIHAEYSYNVALSNIGQIVLYGTVPTV